MTEREAFEVWAKKAGWPHYCVNADGSYFCSSSSWEPWQAATQRSAARIAELEAEVQALRRDAGRWRTFLATRPANTHAVINQAIDDAATRKGGGV